MSFYRRSLIAVVGCMVCGAFLQTLVRWACAARAPIDPVAVLAATKVGGESWAMNIQGHSPFTMSESDFWSIAGRMSKRLERASDPDEMRLLVVEIAGGFGVTARFVSDESEFNTARPRANSLEHELLVGWPWHGLMSSGEAKWHNYDWQWGSAFAVPAPLAPDRKPFTEWDFRVWRAYNIHRVLPFGIRPWAFAANTIAYGVVVWTLLYGVQSSIRWNRRRLGRCQRCAYDVRGLPRCPECGSSNPSPDV